MLWLSIHRKGWLIRFWVKATAFSRKICRAGSCFEVRNKIANCFLRQLELGISNKQFSPENVIAVVDIN